MSRKMVTFGKWERGSEKPRRSEVVQKETKSVVRAGTWRFHVSVTVG